MTKLDDRTFWEATYADGSVLRETDGVRYADIPRDELTEFRLVCDGLDIFRMQTPSGATGRNLRYRRTTETMGTRMIRLGWVPGGPAFLLDLSALDTDRSGVWIANEGFHQCQVTCPHPVGWFDEPVPIGGER